MLEVEQHRHLANKYEDIVNLQGAEAYRSGPTACFNVFWDLWIF